MLDAAELSLSVTFELSAIIIFLDFQCPAAFTANYSRLNDWLYSIAVTTSFPFHHQPNFERELAAISSVEKVMNVRNTTHTD
jgi:hypothetical protein